MFVACSTRCYGDRGLNEAIRHIADLEFNKFDLAIIEGGPHLTPSLIAEDPIGAVRLIDRGPGLTPAALDVEFGPIDETTLRQRFDALRRFARQLTVAVITIPAAPLGTPLEQEIERLGKLSSVASEDGLVLAVRTDRATVTADPNAAMELCETIPGLGITLDPSHYLIGPHAGSNYDALFPHVRAVHFRDTGTKPGEEQVRVGQGHVDYARTINILQRHGYERSLTVAIHNAGDCPFDVDVEVRKLKLLLESLV